MLEFIYGLRPTHLHWEDPEGMPFTNTVKSKFVKGA